MSLLWLCSMPALAGGYFYSDAGIVATGRGGAWVAGADTQFAQYYNPAGLIRVERPTVNVGWSGVQQNVGFRRLRPGADPAEPDAFYDEAVNQASPFSVPQIGFATPLTPDIALAVGFYSPFAPSSLYEEEGPQRYTIKDTLIYQFSVGPSIAVRPHPMLTLGLGLQWKYLQVGQTVDVTVNGDDAQLGDIAVEARVVDLFTPNINAGLLFEPIDQVSVGLAVQPSTQFQARGPASLDFTDSFVDVLLNESQYTDEDVALNLQLPWVVRAGVAVRPVERLEIEAAVVWQDWSSLADISIEEIDITVDSDSIALPPDQRQVDEEIVLPAGLRDTVSWRLGAEVQLEDWLELRAGGFYENAALTPQEVSVALVDTDKVQLGGGGSLYLLGQRLRLDASAAVLLFDNLQIRDSTVSQIDAGVIDGVVPLVVGNGDLRSNGWVVGLQAQWAFGAQETTP
ncbi:MAG: outer membrane protein transport protein [Myxococcales bacterium]|nr:outer membrane protein transport protein [Myxococcales bacterium]